MTTAKPEQAKNPAPSIWSNVPLDEEVRVLTPREKNIADLTEKNKDVKPQLYDITNKNPKALRVVHDHSGRAVTIQPGMTKQGVLLHPNTSFEYDMKINNSLIYLLLLKLPS